MATIHFFWTPLPMEGKAKEKMTDELFREYVKKNGYHFTKSLAKHVSSKMRSSQDLKPWCPDDVLSALKSANIVIPHHCSEGDAVYLANMAKMDFYPHVLKTDADIFKYVDAVMNDVDGYEGQIFSRWLSDDLYLDIVDDWDAFL